MRSKLWPAATALTGLIGGFASPAAAAPAPAFPAPASPAALSPAAVSAPSAPAAAPAGFTAAGTSAGVTSAGVSPAGVSSAGLAPATGLPAPFTRTAAESVQLERTGGITGSHVALQISGNGTAHINEILRLTSSPAFRSLRPRYVPKNTCCDRFHYKIRVEYRNGRTKQVEALQGAPAPTILWTVINKMENMPKPGPFKIDVPMMPFPFTVG